MRIRAVVFDIGGVLLLSTAGDKWPRRLGLSDEDYVQRYRASGAIDANAGRISADELFRRVGAAYQLEGEDLREFREDVWALQEPNLTLIDFLHGLQPHYKTATLSNDFPGARAQQNRLFDLDNRLGVDVMLYSCEEGLQKPEPAFYLLACERLQVQPQEVVFVDDKLAAVDAARDLGMTAILFQDTEQVIAEIQTCLTASR